MCALAVPTVGLITQWPHVTSTRSGSITPDSIVGRATVWGRRVSNCHIAATSGHIVATSRHSATICRDVASNWCDVATKRTKHAPFRVTNERGCPQFDGSRQLPSSPGAMSRSHPKLADRHHRMCRTWSPVEQVRFLAASPLPGPLPASHCNCNQAFVTNNQALSGP